MVKVVSDIFSDPMRLGAAATTFGGSEVARALGGSAGGAAGAAINPVGAATNIATGAGAGGGVSKPSPTPVPSGPATAPDIKNFANYLGSGQSATPQGIQFGAGSSPEQQRSQLATGGTAGNAGAYNTPEVSRFYRDLAIRTLTDQAGNPSGSPLPVERQYAKQQGVTPRDDSTASFLSALLRNDYS